jgi:Tol biopolymer transport system component
VPVEGAGLGATDPVVNQTRIGRLAFTQVRTDTNIWRYEIDAGGKAGNPEKLIATTQQDQDPQYSPDGRRIAYISHSTGAAEVWVCNQKGRGCRALTSHGRSGAGPPRWAPDSRRIVFAVHQPENSRIYSISAEGGAMTQITGDSSNESRPSVSRDGQWIYLRSDRSGRSEIWKRPAAGGNAIQVTRTSAYDAFESPDGTLLFFHKGPSRGIWRIPTSGGEETQVTPQGQNGAWAVARSGLYFIDWEDIPNAKATVYHYSFATKQTRALAALPARPYRGPNFSIASDERSFLVALADQPEADLMLIEGFR